MPSFYLGDFRVFWHDSRNPLVMKRVEFKYKPKHTDIFGDISHSIESLSGFHAVRLQGPITRGKWFVGPLYEVLTTGTGKNATSPIGETV